MIVLCIVLCIINTGWELGFISYSYPSLLSITRTCAIRCILRIFKILSSVTRSVRSARAVVRSLVPCLSYLPERVS